MKRITHKAMRDGGFYAMYCPIKKPKDFYNHIILFKKLGKGKESRFIEISRMVYRDAKSNIIEEQYIYRGKEIDVHYGKHIKIIFKLSDDEIVQHLIAENI